MARTIRALWIEDDLRKDIEDLIEIAQEEVELRSYKFELIEAKNVNEAYEKMKDNYIDIIFSDFNLEEDKSGLDLLNDLRSDKNFKYYVLYSNNNPATIIQDVVREIESTSRMDLFSNFNFFH